MSTSSKLTRWLPLVALVLACSGSHSTAPTQTNPIPTGPSMAAGTALTVQSGETDQPVAGATVTLTGQSSAGAFTTTYTSDSSGQFRLDRTVLLSTAPQVDIHADGFLLRSTLLRSDETTLTLWPSTSATGLTEDFSETIAYSPSGCPTAATGSAPLRKAPVAAATVQISFGSTLQDSIAQTAHQTAITRLNGALGGTPRYELTTSPSSDAIAFVADIDNTDPSCVDDGLVHAITFLNFTAGNISGGRLVYCTLGAARAGNLVIHELGHTVGLYHSSSTSDVMYCSAGRPPDFSARERLVMKLMRQRRAGTRWPDNDRNTSAILSFPLNRTEAIACAER